MLLSVPDDAVTERARRKFRQQSCVHSDDGCGDHGIEFGPTNTGLEVLDLLQTLAR
jgi:hypothetical protein